MTKNSILGHDKQMAMLRVMQKNSMIPQTMLFYGLSGIGKKKVTLYFFQSLVCESLAPCGMCPSCRQIESGTFPDIIELTGNEKGIIPIGDSDEKGTVRWLISRLSKKSVSGKYCVLIDGIEKIPGKGQNALLKTIEEPPLGTIIILLSSNKSLILPTILSRSREIPFSPLNNEHLKEILFNLDCNSEQLDFIAEISGGSVDIAVQLCDNELLDEVVRLCNSLGDSIASNLPLDILFENLQKKIDLNTLLFLLINIFRGLLRRSLKSEGVDDFIKIDKEIDDNQLIKLIKICISLRKGLSNNLNIKNTMKGMVYTLDSLGPVGIPDLDFSHLSLENI